MLFRKDLLYISPSLFFFFIFVRDTCSFFCNYVSLRFFLIIEEFLRYMLVYSARIVMVRGYMDFASYWIGIYAHKSKRFSSRGWIFLLWKFTIPRSLYSVTNIRSLSLVRVFHPFPARKAQYFTGHGGCLWWRCARSRIHHVCNDVTGEHCTGNHDEFIQSAN